MMPYNHISQTDADFTEYLNEYQLQSQHDPEPISHYEDGELEARWLVAAGFQDLTQPFEQGFEISANEIEPIISNLPKLHADAIKQRVKALNRTVRGRAKSRHKRKPDIRDVFKDNDDCSTGTRSRSATPDSLDSLTGEVVWEPSRPNFVSLFDTTPPPRTTKSEKQKLRRTPSAPIKGSTDLFRGSHHVRCDIPALCTTEGVELLNFSRIGTIHLSTRSRSGSDPSCSIGRIRGKLISECNSDNNLSSDYNYKKKENVEIPIETPPPSGENSPSSKEGISFEEMYRDQEFNHEGEDTVDFIGIGSTDIDSIKETDLTKLQPLFWLELATLFDKHKVNLDKRKPFKRRRKEEGNLFSVSLNALIRRDQQMTEEDSSMVPLFVQGICAEISLRGVKEEGILRVAGHKQKTEILYQELESIFYQKPNKVKELLKSSSVHDLCALFKRWLRELPQPLLTYELIQLFYQIHSISPPDQFKALALVCQLLPHENRKTLRFLLLFLNEIISYQEYNKMSKTNVATIMAPSLFPPRFFPPTNRNSIEEQVKMAAQCCHITSVLITKGEQLFMASNSLIDQLRVLDGNHKQQVIITDYYYGLHNF
ncbi:ARHGAP18 family protein [Megaselia abdita]